MRILALFLLTTLVSCLDYHEGFVDSSVNYPPLIDKRYVNPQPIDTLRPINIGSNCAGPTYQVPPISDANASDNLYYLWFFDSKLVTSGIIMPQARSSAVVSITLDRATLENLIGAKLSTNFFGQAHLVEFFVANRQYLIPANKYLDRDALEDYVHWAASFTDNPC